MKPPEEVFPLQKATEFDYSGRPFHPFFYTNKPQYTQLMYEMAEHIGNITSFGDRMRALKVSPNPEEISIFGVRHWLNNNQYCVLLKT